jgi:hypothetical protein
VHLLTDVAWSESIYYPAKVKFVREREEDPKGFIWNLKEDWYDLDYKFLRDHPDFRAFQIYSNAVGFQNDYMEEFSQNAFDNRRVYITSFYKEKKENLDRFYPYLTEKEMDEFVNSCTQNILDILKTQYGLSCCS